MPKPTAGGPIECFPNRHPDRDYEIRIVCPEFTAVCPRTGQPDFATLTLTYVPDARCLELKSLKLYLQSYRNRGIFHEHVTNAILDDLVCSCRPRRMTLVGEFNARGGISTAITATYPAAKSRPPRG
ncbi:MAG: NADPH-dependent 7-cyano-7-deazaguanine reductase QueF [Planctomycetes bacterium]|nr:NADPH-dependent 7-cyano-7-deazaguanine reductase QueF [Planctomycetota bacterium]